MLYNGEHIGDGIAAAGRHRRRPARGHDAVRAKGMPSALAVIALVRARHDVRPRPVRLHGEAGRRPTTSPTCSTSTARSARPSSSSPSAAASTSATSWSSCSTARATRRASTAIREAGARVRLITDGDVSAALLAVVRRARRSTCSGASAARPRACISAAAIKCIGGGLVGRLWPRDDEERQAALDAGYDLDRQLTQDDLVRATTASSPRPASPTATCSRACATRAARRDDRVARHALALGHGAPRPRDATTAQAARRHRRALRLTSASARAARDAGRPARRGARGPAVLALGRSPALEAADPRLLEVEPRERAQEAVRDEHVDARLRDRVDPAR